MTDKSSMLEYLTDTRQSLLGQVAAIERLKKALDKQPEPIICPVCEARLSTLDGIVPQHNVYDDSISICVGSGQIGAQYD